MNILLYLSLIFCVSPQTEINRNFNKKSAYSIQQVEVKQVHLPVNSFKWDPVQYVESQNKKYFVYYNSSRRLLYWLDYQTGMVVEDKTISIPAEVSNAKFFALSPDSILILDYGRTTTLYLLEVHRDVVNWVRYILGTSKGSTLGTREEPYISNGNEIFLTGIFVDETVDKPGVNFLCYSYNFQTKLYRAVSEIDYPPDYYRYHWGGGIMRFVHSKACYHKKNILYSFPISHDVHVYDVSGKKITKYDGGSSLIENILPYSRQKSTNPAGSVDYLKYNFEQPSYYSVLYDPRHKLYYRLAGLPSENFDIKDVTTYKKSLSVIIFDDNFQFLGETLLGDMYHPQNAFVNEKGLHITYQESLGGNIITYHVFEPKRINQ